MIKAMTSKRRFSIILRGYEGNNEGGMSHTQSAMLQVWIVKVSNSLSTFKMPKYHSVTWKKIFGVGKTLILIPVA